MKNIILHLGGTWKRAETAADIAQYLDDFIVIVSSEGSEDKFRAIYENAGIPSSKVIHDRAAWDTCTNFINTYRLIKALKCERLWVVTSDWHMPRAKAICEAVWRGRIDDIQYVEHPHSPEKTKIDSKFIAADRIRALVWRWFGVLFYWKIVAEQRKAKLNSGHSWIEIPM